MIFPDLIDALRRAGQLPYARRVAERRKPCRTLQRAALLVAHEILSSGATPARAEAITKLLDAAERLGKREQIEAALARQWASHERRFGAREAA